MKASHSGVERLIKTARGQLDGVLKMIEEDRYCIDISNQLLAAEAILRKANQKIIAAHLKSCVIHAKPGEELDVKLKEITDVMEHMAK